MNLINSIPYRITAPGVYGLGQSFDAGALGGTPAIEIAASTVVIDFLGQWIINSAGPASEAVGIHALNQSYCIVRNAMMFGAGWRYPIHFENTDGYGSGSNTVIDCPLLSGNFRGVRMEGSDNMVSRCIFKDVGGATWTPDSFAMAIEMYGPRPVVIDNVIHSVTAVGSGESIGISFTNHCTDALARNNVMTNPSRRVKTMAVWTGEEQTNVDVLDNVFRSWEFCLFGDTISGVADGNRDFDCGALDSPPSHPKYWIPGINSWTGGNMGT